MTASARFRLGYGASSTGPWTWAAYDTSIDVTAGQYVKVQLESTSGVNSFSCSVFSADPTEYAARGLPTVTIDAAAKTAVFQTPVAATNGFTYLVKCTINGGIVTSSERYRIATADYEKSLAVHAVTPAGMRLVAIGETSESSRTSGWLSKINTAITTGIVNLGIKAAGVVRPTRQYLSIAGGLGTDGWTSDATNNFLTLPTLVVRHVKDPPNAAAGDGLTDDCANLNLQIAALSTAGGGVMQFDEGTFLIETGYLELYDNVTLQGIPGATIIKRASGLADGNVGLLQPHADGITNAAIRDLVLDNSEADYTGPLATASSPTVSILNTVGMVVSNVVFRNTITMAVWADSIAGDRTLAPRIENCLIESSRGGGFSFFGEVHDAVLVGNVIRYTQDDAIAFQARVDSAIIYAPRNPTITGNMVYGADKRNATSSTPNGIVAFGVHGCTMTGNVVDRTIASGLYAIQGVGSVAQAITITGNTVTHAGMPRVTSAGTTPPEVQVDYTDATVTTGYRIEITTPGARGTAKFKWQVDGGGWTTGVTTAEYVTLSGTGTVVHFPFGTYSANNVYTWTADAVSTAGIYVALSDYVTVSGNTITKSRMSGIWLNGSDHVAINGNTVCANGRNGVEIYDSTFVNITGNLSNGNGLSKDAGAATSSGVLFYGTTNHVVCVGNHFCSNLYDGIYFGTPATLDHFLFDNNDLNHNTNAPLTGTIIPSNLTMGSTGFDDGLLSEAPSSWARIGQRFYATDLGMWLTWDGGAWIKPDGFVASVPANILTDGDMEAADFTAWNVWQVTATKDATKKRPGTAGSQSSKLEYDATHAVGGIINLVALIAGHTYRIYGWARGDGTAAPDITDGTNVVWAGSALAEWQYFARTFEAAGAFPFVNCGCHNLATGLAVWFDDVAGYEVV